MALRVSPPIHLHHASQSFANNYDFGSSWHFLHGGHSSLQGILSPRSSRICDLLFSTSLQHSSLFVAQSVFVILPLIFDLCASSMFMACPPLAFEVLSRKPSFFANLP
eukprot:Gb_38120 [translate_table: standard]